MNLQDRMADVGAVTSVSCATVGITIGQLNQYLQAGAFIVAIISGLCASYYYIRRSRSKNADH